MKNGYRYLLTSFISIGITLLVNDLMEFHVPFYLFFILEFFIIIVLHLIQRYKKNAAFYISLEGVALFSFIIIWILNIPYLSFFDTLIHWWMEGMKMEEVTIAYPIATLVLLLLVLSFFVYYMQTHFPIRIFFAITLASMLLMLGFLERKLSILPVFFLFMYCFFLIYEIITYLFHYRRGNANSPYAITTYLIPVIFIIVLASCLLPHSEDPIQWTYVKNAYNGMRDWMESIPGKLGDLLHTSSQEFVLNMTGYSDKGVLGKGVLDSDSVSLSLQTSYIPRGSLYLNGSIMDTYTGDSWESNLSYKEDCPDYLLDAYELLSAIARYGALSNPGLWDVVEKKEITLTFEDISTKTAFYPSKTIDLKISKDLPYFNQGDNILFQKLKKKGTEYRFTYCNPNYSDEWLIRFMQSQSSFTSNPNEGVLPNDPPLTESEAIRLIHKQYPELIDQLPKNPDQSLTERRDRIYLNYTGLPDALPERVVDLARDLTKDCNNAYDQLKALETYLNTMVYTKQPAPPPEGRDVVDYFLFESNEGYCTYFASSMAVMARCIGLPSRYIQGFTTSFKNRHSNYTYHVASNRAHAWVEVYLDGIGWVPFEPTSGYEGVRYLEWLQKKQGITVKKKAQITAPLTPSYHENDEEVMDLETTKKKPITILLLLIIVVLLLMAFAVIMFLYPFIIRKQYEKHYRHMDDEGKYFLEFYRIMTLLSALGLSISEGETLSFFTSRVLKSHPDMQSVSSAYYPIRYGNGSVREEDLSVAVDFRMQLEVGLKEKIGKLRYRFVKTRTLNKMQNVSFK